MNRQQASGEDRAQVVEWRVVKEEEIPFFRCVHSEVKASLQCCGWIGRDELLNIWGGSRILIFPLAGASS
jgi:hypothetical protein